MLVNSIHASIKNPYKNKKYYLRWKQLIIKSLQNSTFLKITVKFSFTEKKIKNERSKEDPCKEKKDTSKQKNPYQMLSLQKEVRYLKEEWLLRKEGWSPQKNACK